MQEAYGTPMTSLGQGGSVPLCNVFAEVYPTAEVILMGVEEPLALIHAPNESVDPSEIAMRRHWHGTVPSPLPDRPSAGGGRR